MHYYFTSRALITPNFSVLKFHKFKANSQFTVSKSLLFFGVDILSEESAFGRIIDLVVDFNPKELITASSFGFPCFNSDLVTLMFYSLIKLGINFACPFFSEFY